MKKLSILLAILMIAGTLFAQSPQKFTYQAVVRNASDQLVTNAPVGVRISILSGGTAGDIVYSETHTTATNINGLFTLEVGSGSVQQGTFSDIEWGAGMFFLKTEIDPTGGNNYTITSTQQLLSVPYALYANEAGNGFSGNYNDLTNLPQIPTVPTNVSAFTNDAGYLTSFTEEQVLSISNDTIFLTGGGFVKLPEGFDGNYYSLTNRPILFDGNYHSLIDTPYLAAVATTGSYNDLSDTPVIPTVPTNVSAFTNDVGYLTSFTEQQVLSISNDTIFLTGGGFVKLPEGFDGDYYSLTNRPILFDSSYHSLIDTPNLAAVATTGSYNDLSDTPVIPTVPTNVSAFTNDAGYLTTVNVQEAANIPTVVSAFQNDAGYVTTSELNAANYITLSQVPAQVNADWNATVGAAQILNKPDLFSGNYNDLTNKPTLFSGDYNDLRNKPTLFSGNYNDLSNKPVLFDGNYYSLSNRPSLSAVATSGSYNDLTDKPNIPTVPTNISSFVNDAGYITAIPDSLGGISLESDPIFSAWNKDYNDLINTPTIPTVPTNVSVFTNDAGYITMDSIPTIPTVPTNVSDFSNDAGYITMDSIPEIPVVPTNVSSFTNDAGYLTGYTETDPQFNAWDKDYNDLINKPTIPTVPTNVSAFSNDAGYITMDSIPAFPTVPTNVSTFINDAGYITMDSIPAIPTIPTNVSVFNNDAGYLTEYSENQNLADVTAHGNSAGSRQLKDVSDPTEAYDAVNLRTLNLLMDSIRAQFHQMQQQIDSLENRINELENNYMPTQPDTTTLVDGQPCPGTPTVTDYDGNVYNTVQIGEQCWMKENLRTTHYADGIIIPNGGLNSSTFEPYYYNYDFSDFSLYERGYLYNWSAVMHGSSSSDINPSGVQGICPFGWHVPSDGEWEQLTDYISNQNQYLCGGDSTYIAKALASPTGWFTNTYNCAVGNMQGSNNATGFNAFPVGCFDNHLNGIGQKALFWSSTAQNFSGDYAFLRSFLYQSYFVRRYGSQSYYGCSVRCLRDSAVCSSNYQAQLTVTTSAATSITATTATFNGIISCPNDLIITAQGFEWKNTDNDAYSQIVVFGDTISHSLISYIFTGLTPNTSYIYRTFVTTEERTYYGEEITFSTFEINNNDAQACIGMPTITDYDGNTYNTVQIGQQCWMKENLRTTHYIDGTAIPIGDTNLSEILPYYYDYSSSSIPISERGYLYNWPAVMHGSSSSNANPSGVQGICPIGWHVPSDSEWTQLIQYVGTQSQNLCNNNSTYIAKALASNTKWFNSTGICTVGNTPSSNNATGFTVLPAGYCWGGSCVNSGRGAYFWSSTTDDNNRTVFIQRLLDSYPTLINYERMAKSYGYSVRCLRDETFAVIDGKSCPETPTVTDHEGNVYATVQIGDQCWMRENLRTTTSPSTGTYLIASPGTGNTHTGKQARWYNNDSITYAPMNYGLLYNWNAAVDTFNTAYGETSVNISITQMSMSFTGYRRGICPLGWHVPSDAEWAQLTDYVSSQNQYVCGAPYTHIAKALASTTGWENSTNTCAVGNDQSSNNITGFSALPSGIINTNNNFIGSSTDTRFWSTTESGNAGVYVWCISSGGPNVGVSYNGKSTGCSVRCLRDENNGGNTSQTQPTVTTSAATNITATSATLNGVISNPDNVTITTRGFEWKATENGTYVQVTSSGDTMSCNLTGLTPNTSYTYRAFVTTAEGTNYGNEMIFTTLENTINDVVPVISGLVDIDPARPLHGECNMNVPDYATLRAHFDANITVTHQCPQVEIDTVVFYLGNTNVVADGNLDVFDETDSVTIYAVVEDKCGNVSEKTPVFQIHKPAPMGIAHGAIMLDTLELCVDATTNMHFNDGFVLNAARPYTYQWSQIDYGSQAVITTDPDNYLEAVVSPAIMDINTSSIFIMTVTDAYGCVASDTTNSVHFYRLPTAEIISHPYNSGNPINDGDTLCPNYGHFHMIVGPNTASNLPDSIIDYSSLNYEWSGDVQYYPRNDSYFIRLDNQSCDTLYTAFLKVTNQKNCSATDTFHVYGVIKSLPVITAITDIVVPLVADRPDNVIAIPDFVSTNVYFNVMTVQDECFRLDEMIITQDIPAGTLMNHDTTVVITFSAPQSWYLGANSCWTVTHAISVRMPDTIVGVPPTFVSETPFTTAQFTICEGNTFTEPTIEVNTNDGEVTKTWTIDGVVLNFNNPYDATFNGKEVKLVISNEFGSNEYAVPAVIYPMPVPEMLNDTVLCADPMNVVSLEVANGPFNTYSWRDVNGTQVASTQSASINLGTLGYQDTVLKYYVVVTDANGCESQLRINASHNFNDTICSDFVTVRVTTKPVFKFMNMAGVETHDIFSSINNITTAFKWTIDDRCAANTNEKVYIHFSIYHNGVLIPEPEISEYLATNTTNIGMSFYNWNTNQVLQYIAGVQQTSYSYYEHASNNFPNFLIGSCQYDWLYLPFLTSRYVTNTYTQFRQAGDYDIHYELYATDGFAFADEYDDVPAGATYHIGGHGTFSATLLTSDVISIHVDDGTAY